MDGLFIVENPTKMDDLGIPLFLETPISKYIILHLYYIYTYILSPWN